MEEQTTHNVPVHEMVVTTPSFSPASPQSLELGRLVELGMGAGHDKAGEA